MATISVKGRLSAVAPVPYALVFELDSRVEDCPPECVHAVPVGDYYYIPRSISVSNSDLVCADCILEALVMLFLKAMQP